MITQYMPSLQSAKLLPTRKGHYRHSRWLTTAAIIRDSAYYRVNVSFCLTRFGRVRDNVWVRVTLICWLRLAWLVTTELRSHGATLHIQ
jgi:hypothetical protein